MGGSTLDKQLEAVLSALSSGREASGNLDDTAIGKMIDYLRLPESIPRFRHLLDGFLNSKSTDNELAMLTALELCELYCNVESIGELFERCKQEHLWRLPSIRECAYKCLTRLCSIQSAYPLCRRYSGEALRSVLTDYDETIFVVKVAKRMLLDYLVSVALPDERRIICEQLRNVAISIVEPSPTIIGWKDPRSDSLEILLFVAYHPLMQDVNDINIDCPLAVYWCYVAMSSSEQCAANLIDRLSNRPNSMCSFIVELLISNRHPSLRSQSIAYLKSQRWMLVDSTKLSLIYETVLNDMERMSLLDDIVTRLESNEATERPIIPRLIRVVTDLCSRSCFTPTQSLVRRLCNNLESVIDDQRLIRCDSLLSLLNILDDQTRRSFCVTTWPLFRKRDDWLVESRLVGFYAQSQPKVVVDELVKGIRDGSNEYRAECFTNYATLANGCYEGEILEVAFSSLRPTDKLFASDHQTRLAAVKLILAAIVDGADSMERLVKAVFALDDCADGKLEIFDAIVNLLQRPDAPPCNSDSEQRHRLFDVALAIADDDDLCGSNVLLQRLRTLRKHCNGDDEIAKLENLIQLTEANIESPEGRFQSLLEDILLAYDHQHVDPDCY